MKSLVELQNEIQTLQQQAAELRSREFDRTVADIVAQMAAFGITLAQLKGAMKKVPAGPGKGKGQGKGRPRAGARPAARTATARRGKAGAKAGAKTGSRGPARIKFRGPAGETWSGRGKTPTWLKALLASGRQADDFRI